ncbi:MAG: hypothetical protein RLY20_1320 [Verrucomicrobiota bacterium]
MKIVTLVVLVLLLGAPVVSSVTLPESTPLLARLSATLLPLLILAATLPFIVRGYVLTEGELRIERLGWQNRFKLADVKSVVADPEAMRWSIRLFGSGGLFGFFGIFRNKTLGTYRAYGTNPKNTVVVELRQLTIVVTPDDPKRFVAEVTQRCGGAASPEPAAS